MNIYEQVLTKFTTDEQSRFDLSSIFKFNELACATNGHVLAMTNAFRIPNAEVRERTPNAAMVVASVKTSSRPQILKCADYQLTQEQLNVAKKRKCLTCEGVGGVEYCITCFGEGDFANGSKCKKCKGHGGKPNAESPVTCDRCDGSGWLWDWKAMVKHPVLVKKIQILPPYWLWILESAELLGSETIEHWTPQSGANTFHLFQIKDVKFYVAGLRK